MSREYSPTPEQLQKNLEFLGNYESSRPVIATAAPPALRKLFLSSRWNDKLGELAIKSVNVHLQAYNEDIEAAKNPHLNTSTQAKEVTTLFDEAAKKIDTLLAEDPDNVDAVASVMSPSVARATWAWHSMPYPVFWDIQQRFFATEHVARRVNLGRETGKRDLDQWILKNENWLRQRAIQNKGAWSTGLVTLSSMVWSLSTLKESYREITRVQVDGFTCLDARRSSSIYIQPNISSFSNKFRDITNGQLDGLDWSNIFIAGGIVLGALLCVDKEAPMHTSEQWKGSDIDIYICGLDPIEATKKIEHLFKVFIRNLPEGAEILVVRNTKTISFLSKFPHRRFQIILKICPTPAEVLLNFDLDICAMGYDGNQLYMLPRAARALETGYNVFTMDVVRGHYLGTRRASQEQRVFKYADKGYGIRILPHYVEALKLIDISTLSREDYPIRYYNQPELEKRLVIAHVVEKARQYTSGCIKAYLNWTKNGKTLERHYVTSSSWKGTTLIPSTTKPVFTHALLDTTAQKNSEPQMRSCLTGFELFYRHIALWEEEQAGNIYIQPDVWASTIYDETGYEDLPNYSWDETFRIDDFAKVLDEFNESKAEDLGSFLSCQNERVSGWRRRHDPTQGMIEIKRVAHGNNIEDVLNQTLYIGVAMPIDFVEYAQGIIEQVRNDHPYLSSDPLITKIRSLKEPIVPNSAFYGITILPNWMFQQVDRRLDEIFEVIWSFMFSQAQAAEEGSRGFCCRFKRELSRRAVRTKPEDEFRAFASWIIRKPGPTSNYAGMGQGFWTEALGDAYEKYRIRGGDDDEVEEDEEDEEE